MQDYSSASDGNDLFAGIIRNASGANRTTNAVKFFSDRDWETLE